MCKGAIVFRINCLHIFDRNLAYTFANDSKERQMCFIVYLCFCVLRFFGWGTCTRHSHRSANISSICSSFEIPNNIAWAYRKMNKYIFKLTQVHTQTLHTQTHVSTHKSTHTNYENRCLDVGFWTPLHTGMAWHGSIWFCSICISPYNLQYIRNAQWKA